MATCCLNYGAATSTPGYNVQQEGAIHIPQIKATAWMFVSGVLQTGALIYSRPCILQSWKVHLFYKIPTMNATSHFLTELLSKHDYTIIICSVLVLTFSSWVGAVGGPTNNGLEQQLNSEFLTWQVWIRSGVSNLQPAEMCRVAHRGGWDFWASGSGTGHQNLGQGALFEEHVSGRGWRTAALTPEAVAAMCSTTVAASKSPGRSSPGMDEFDTPVMLFEHLDIMHCKVRHSWHLHIIEILGLGPSPVEIGELQLEFVQALGGYVFLSIRWWWIGQSKQKIVKGSSKPNNPLG